MFFCERFVAFDHQTELIYLVGLVATNATTTDSAEQDVQEWFDEMERIISYHITHSGPAPPLTADPIAAAAAAATFLNSIQLARPDAQYGDDIAECLRCIAMGESYELCLTNKVLLPQLGLAQVDLRTALQWYRQLRRVNPAPYAAFIYLPDTVAVLCSSPEKLVSVTKSGHAMTKPIKGTRPRGATPSEDAALHASLASSRKDFAENLMITDLSRNDLGRVCELGTVQVPSLMRA
jgi:para-aminobenzoate synthetase